MVIERVVQNAHELFGGLAVVEKNDLGVHSATAVVRAKEFFEERAQSNHVKLAAERWCEQRIKYSMAAPEFSEQPHTTQSHGSGPRFSCRSGHIWNAY